MKVLILTEGGKKIGFGHITRCISLCEAFKEKDIAPLLIVNGDNIIVDLIKTHTKNKKYRIFNWLEERRKLFKMLTGADIVIIDSYLARKDLYNKISEIIPKGLLVMIDDYNRMEYPRGVVINPSIYGERINYPQKEALVYLLGKRYIILRKRFWKIPIKTINKHAKNVLIMFGGISHPNLLYRIISYLENIFSLNFYAVEPSKNRLNTKEVLNLMLKADICISGGGQTIYELARIGVPTIGICLTENQRLNLEGWQKERFIEYAGWHDDSNLLGKIEEGINKLMPYPERVLRSNNAKRLVDGKGPQRIISNLLHNN